MRQSPRVHVLVDHQCLVLDNSSSSLRLREDLGFQRPHLQGRSHYLVFLTSSAGRGTGTSIRRWRSEAASGRSTSVGARRQTSCGGSAVFVGGGSVIHALLGSVFTFGSVSVEDCSSLSAIANDMSRSSTMEADGPVVSCPPYVCFPLRLNNRSGSPRNGSVCWLAS